MEQDRDLEEEMNQLLIDIPIGLILDDGETEMKTDLLDAVTKPSTVKKGGAMETVASQRCFATNDEGGNEQRHNSGHPCQGLPIITNND